MGSVQSRKESNTQFIKSDVEIIISEPDYSDNEEEFYECLTDLIGKDLTILKSDENIPNFENEQADTSENHEGLQMNSNKEIHTEESDDSSAEIKKRQQRELEEFREEINRKRALRQQCIKKLRDELKDLNEKLSYQMMINEQLRESIDNRSDDVVTNDVNVENKNLKMELAECQMYLQKVNGENLTVNIENQALRDHIRSLKEVNKAMKEMLAIRECQVDQLKSKLDEIESSFCDKEATILSTDLKQEYQRQLENIRSMRSLYEERTNLLLQENNMLKQQLGDKEHDLETEIEKSKNFEEYIATLESNLNVKNDDIANLENQITLLKSEKLQINEEMNAVNQLISQILFDFNATGNNVNFDMLYSMLEENRDFLKEMALKEDYGGIDGGSFLPRMLYDLFLQVNQKSDENSCENIEAQRSVSSPEDIALKLPKVFRILIELLNHHQNNNQKDESKEEDEKSNEKSVLDDCYKSVPTSSGSQAVLSVSKTFIKLRDLIFEKRSLQKDTTRLKTLYSHLEQRLDKQEKKLSSVSLELTKTWHLVGKIKRQHRQLHTHEQILCYQLQQKRRVLNELKAELEYCRKKWALARAINKESEKQCKELRDEFISRKIQDQNSAESGYSDDHASDGDECEKKNITCENDKARFERNLSEFYRIPLYLIDSDRRRSLELPILYQLFPVDISITPPRAQSEPPADFDLKEHFDKIYLLPEQDCDEKSEISCSIVEVEQHLENLNGDSVLVTLPPDVHELKKNETKPKIKNDLQKSKKHKKKKNAISGTESAEDMFKRLTRSINGEISTTTEEIDEELENIEEIPMDIVDRIQETCPVQNEEKISSDNTDIQMECEKQETFNPTTSAEDDYLKTREARLARLEAETKEFYEKMTRNKEKRIELDNRLANAHKSFLERQKDKSENVNSQSSDSSEDSKPNNDLNDENKTDDVDDNDENSTI
ncbi:hypothetical protein ACKWTF_012047 [Chironomus riparius]